MIEPPRTQKEALARYALALRTYHENLRSKHMPDDDLKPKRNRQETLFSTIAMARIRETMRRLAHQWLAAVALPAFQVEDALRMAMDEETDALLRKATEFCPDQATNTVHITLRIPADHVHYETHTLFQTRLGERRLVPTRLVWQDRHEGMPVMQALREHAHHRAFVDRQLTTAWHLIQYLNVVVPNFRQLRVVWPEFADIFNGQMFSTGRKDDWTSSIQATIRNANPSRPPELFPGCLTYINDAKGWIAAAQLAVPALEVPTPNKLCEVQVSRSWSQETENVPWHGQILWENTRSLSQTMDWVLR
jgi:hypothetical protein